VYRLSEECLDSLLQRLVYLKSISLRGLGCGAAQLKTVHEHILLDQFFASKKCIEDEVICRHVRLISLCRLPRTAKVAAPAALRVECDGNEGDYLPAEHM
jgi:hypothetical protein